MYINERITSRYARTTTNNKRTNLLDRFIIKGGRKMKDYLINYERLSFEEKITLKINYLLSLPGSPEVKSALLNLEWVLEIYQEEQNKNKRR